MLRDLSPLLVRSATGLPVKDELRRFGRKAQALQLSERQCKDLARRLQLSDCIDNALWPEVRRKRECQHG